MYIYFIDILNNDYEFTILNSINVEKDEIYEQSLDTHSGINQKYIILANKNVEKNEIIKQFLSNSKLDSGKFAGKIFIEILSNFFGELEDIEETYEKYYSDEYATLSDYMYKSMLLNRDEIDFVFKNLKENEKIYFVDLVYISPEYHELILSPEYDKYELLKKINNVLEMIH